MKRQTIYTQPFGDLVELSDRSVHVVLTSPPYNLSYPRSKSKKFNLPGYGPTCPDCLPEMEYQDQQVAVLEALARVLDDDGSIFYVHKDRRVDGRTISPMEWLSRVRGISLFQTIVWDRGSSHNVDPCRLPPTTEYVFWFSRSGSKPRFHKACRKWGLVWSLSPHAETARIPHPAPFPLAIPLRCILLSDARGDDLILDPYAGSGSTLVAATILGLPSIGYEINPGYVSLAQSRIEAARSQWYPAGQHPGKAA